MGTSVRTGSKATLVASKVADVSMSGTLLKHNRLQMKLSKARALLMLTVM